jgi:hypothetical protein
MLLGPLELPDLPGGVLGGVLVANSSLSRAVPPGMAERARRHVAAAQLQLLAGLPEGAVRRVQVGGVCSSVLSVHCCSCASAE